MKRLIIFGISGNIGEQALEVLKNDHTYNLVAFSVGHNTKIIDSLIKRFNKLEAVYLIDAKLAKQYQKKYKKIKFYAGQNGLEDLLSNISCDLLLNSLVGFAGLAPTLKAIQLNEDIALANKESLVVGGELVKKALKKSKSKIYPVDSEHSAIYKCFKACKRSDVKEILVTASGGAFRDYTRNELKNVTPEKALKHPTWKMGPKVTIDSASMLNKGFELIEAYYLFNFPISKIKVLMHDESCVHSVLRLKDGSYLGEVNAPTMLNPIRYALCDRMTAHGVKRVKKINDFGPYHFHQFNPKRYPMVGYALEALEKKGTMPCVINAVDEVCVKLFLENKISFLDIERMIKLALSTFKAKKVLSLDTLIKADKEAREWANKIVLGDKK